MALYLATGVVSMRKVEHIEHQIRELSQAEFAELREWILGQDWAAWDAQIEADSRHPSLRWFWIGTHTEYDKLIG